MLTDAQKEVTRQRIVAIVDIEEAGMICTKKGAAYMLASTVIVMAGVALFTYPLVLIPCSLGLALMVVAAGYAWRGVYLDRTAARRLAALYREGPPYV